MGDNEAEPNRWRNKGMYDLHVEKPTFEDTLDVRVQLLCILLRCGIHGGHSVIPRASLYGPLTGRAFEFEDGLRFRRSIC